MSISIEDCIVRQAEYFFRGRVEIGNRKTRKCFDATITATDLHGSRACEMKGRMEKQTGSEQTHQSEGDVAVRQFVQGHRSCLIGFWPIGHLKHVKQRRVDSVWHRAAFEDFSRYEKGAVIRSEQDRKDLLMNKRLAGDARRCWCGRCFGIQTGLCLPLQHGCFFVTRGRCFGIQTDLCLLLQHGCFAPHVSHTNKGMIDFFLSREWSW